MKDPECRVSQTQVLRWAHIPCAKSPLCIRIQLLPLHFDLMEAVGCRWFLEEVHQCLESARSVALSKCPACGKRWLPRMH